MKISADDLEDERAGRCAVVLAPEHDVPGRLERCELEQVHADGASHADCLADKVSFLDLAGSLAEAGGRLAPRESVALQIDPSSARFQGGELPAGRYSLQWRTRTGAEKRIEVEPRTSEYVDLGGLRR